MVPSSIPRRVRASVACVVFVLAFALYLKTLTPTVALVDSGELTIAAWCLGNAHPPGFPLYLALTHLFTLLPIGSIAVRGNVASAFLSAVAAAMLSLSFGEIALTRVVPRPEVRSAETRQERRRRTRSEAVTPTVAVRLRELGTVELALLMLATG